MNTPPAEAKHLCVLVHGLWGNPVHLSYLEETLYKQHPDSGIHVLLAKSNASNFTYDGIEVGGERIAHETMQKIDELERAGAKLEKISMVGYSLGGLVARYAIGLLHQDGVFDKLQPVNFTTFASPHLGTRAPVKGFSGFVWNGIGARILSVSGRQMWANDDFRDTGRPLLAIMADPNSIFMHGLRRFRNKSVYANTQNDRSTPYYTTSMSRTNPFDQLDKLDLHYLAGHQEKVILDPEHPVSLRTTPEEEQTLLQRLGSYQQAAIKNLPFYALLTVFLPIGVTFLLINSGYQTFKSAERVRLHEQGLAGISRGRYRVPLLEEVQALQDRAMERLTEEHPEEYLPTPPPEAESPASQGGEKRREKILSIEQNSKEPSPFPVLALTEEQLTMIDNLRQVGITVYPVHIQKVRHTHAAIVVRTNRASFGEGKVVVGHWASSFEV